MTKTGRKQYNISMKTWSKEEEQLLKEYYEKEGAVFITKLIKRSRQAVNTKAARMGLKVNETTKKKIAKEMGKKNLNHKTGSENNNWKGGKKSNYFYKKRSIAKYKERDICRNEFYRKVKKGEIKRMPCIICGETKSEGHHEDYTKPSLVIWLCRKHHIEYDKKRREKEKLKL